MNPAKATSQKRRADEKTEERLEIRDLRSEEVERKDFMKFDIEVVRRQGWRMEWEDGEENGIGRKGGGRRLA